MISKDYPKWGLIILVFVILGIFLLNVVGELFIQEIIQEVAFEEGEKEVFDIDIDKKAPHWELLNLESETVKLSDFLVDPVVVTFWTSWNLMSADQIQIFDQYLSENDESLFKIVAINNQEDKSIVSNFIKRGKYEVRVLLDETGEVGELYNVRTLPLTYFIDKEGIVRDVFSGVLSKEMLVEKIEKLIR